MLAANDRADAVGQHSVIVEFAGAALRNQTRRDGKLDEILKFDVAGAVEDAGSREIDGADSPQADGQNRWPARECGVGSASSRTESIQAVYGRRQLVTGQARRS